MPLLLLTARLEVESIYKNTYPAIFSEPETEDSAMMLINCLITEVIDPKLYYSRFSFLESGKEAVDIKNRMHKGLNQKPPEGASPSPFLPSVKSKFYTRSTLVKNLFPIPSEGKVRAMFIEPTSTINKLPKLGKRSNTIGPFDFARSPNKPIGMTTENIQSTSRLSHNYGLKPSESKLSNFH